MDQDKLEPTLKAPFPEILSPGKIRQINVKKSAFQSLQAHAGKNFMAYFSHFNHYSQNVLIHRNSIAKLCKDRNNNISEDL